jgi:putative ABC transport system permease protein
MALLRRFASGVAALFRRRQAERELDDELGAYLDASIQEKLQSGLDRADAERAARAEIGSLAAVKDHTRDAGWESHVESAVQDVRYAVRTLRRSPGFAAVAIITLALAIGGNTAIFQLADAVRLRPLPVAHPEQLVEVRMANPERGRMGTFAGRRPLYTHAMWESLQRRQQAFSGLVAWGAYPVNVSASRTVQAEQGLWVSGSFFEVLGVSPQLGRLLAPADDHPGCGSPVAVLGHAFWKRQYGGDPSIVGRRIMLDGRPFEIVGVAPRRFVGLEVGRTFDVATPLCAERILNRERSALSDRAWWWLAVVGRLAPGWSEERASAHLAAISKDLFKETVPAGQPPDLTDAYLSSVLATYPAETGVSTMVREDYTTALAVLLAVAGIVLVIAAANIATLLLARATARERDAAVRLALGASRSRLVRQFVTESLLLAAIGAMLGIVVAQVLSEGLVQMLQTSGFQFMAIAFDLQPNWRVLAFAAVVAIVTCALFGLAPALVATRPGRTALVRAMTRTSTAARPRARLRSALVVVQVALALALLVTALLFVRTLRNVSIAASGFDPHGIAILVVINPEVPPAQRHLAAQQVLASVRSVPGAEAAAIVSMVPFTGESWTDKVVVDGVQLQQDALLNRVSQGFFATIGTPLVAGRDFTQEDGLAAPRVAIVNESFARQVLRGRTAIGSTFQFPTRPGSQPPTFEVVGVVKDIKHFSMRDLPTPAAFFPVTQQRQPPEYVNLLVRTKIPSAVLSVADAIGRLQPSSVILTLSLESQIQDQVLRERLMATLSGAFAIAAALLALIGLYGVVAYGVTQRNHEIGIRMALGARRSEVLAVVLRQSLTLVAIGVSIGAVVAAVAAPSLRGLLFDLSPFDAASYLSVVAVFLVVATAAAYIPARRATRVDPLVALRCE